MRTRGVPWSWTKRASVRVQTSRQDAIDIEAAARAWAARAPRFGFCTGCGAMIDEANGRLHDEGCITAEPERCAKGQIT